MGFFIGQTMNNAKNAKLMLHSQHKLFCKHLVNCKFLNRKCECVGITLFTLAAIYRSEFREHGRHSYFPHDFHAHVELPNCFLQCCLGGRPFMLLLHGKELTVCGYTENSARFICIPRLEATRL